MFIRANETCHLVIGDNKLPCQASNFLFSHSHKQLHETKKSQTLLVLRTNWNPSFFFVVASPDNFALIQAVSSLIFL